MFLFGAGSAYEWNAPSTSEITELVLASGFKMCDNETTITKFIYQTLIDNGYESREINFETIVSVIEELIVYYSSFDSQKGRRSLLSCFFESKFDNEILNFSIEGGIVKHGYNLNIPRDTKYNFSRPSLQNETPAQFFFEFLLGEILSNISARIIEYSYHSSKYSKVDFKSEHSQSFVEWMALHQKQTPLRLYTLNYDRVFKTLLERNGFELFEGFDVDGIDDSYFGIRPNVQRILSDVTTNIFYNLHGSTNWDVQELDVHQLANPEILFRKYPNLPGNNTPASVQIERGKTLMVTNFVTGYQKAQKAMITPFKQMQSAFDKDCVFADEVYIVGYSFGDEHINGSLKTAVKHNRDLKIIIVDPFFRKNNIDEEVSIKIFSSAGISPTFPRKLDDRVHSHVDGRFIAYSMSFKDFRERQLNLFNKAAEGIMDD